MTLLVVPQVSVLTSTAALPARAEFERAARDLLPRSRVSWEARASGATILVDGARVRLDARASPVPNAEADTAAFLSLSSVNGAWRLGRHTSHLALTLEGELQRPSEGLLNRLSGATRAASRLETLSALTRVAAAVTRATESLGVYWSAGPVTHSPAFFGELAKESPLPLPLWVGVSVTPEPGDRLGLLSFGMKQLGLPDLLLTAPREDAEDSLDFFFSALATIAERDEPPAEGETIPRSLLQRPRVRYVPSPVDSTARVWRLEL